MKSLFKSFYGVNQKDENAMEKYVLFNKKTLKVYDKCYLGEDKKLYIIMGDGSKEYLYDVIYTDEMNTFFENELYICGKDLFAVNDAINKFLLSHYYIFTEQLRKFYEIRRSYKEQKDDIYAIIKLYDGVVEKCDDEALLRFYGHILDVNNTYTIRISRDKNGNVDYYNTINSLLQQLYKIKLNKKQTEMVNFILNEANKRKDVICFTLRLLPDLKYTLLTKSDITELKKNWKNSLNFE